MFIQNYPCLFNDPNYIHSGFKYVYFFTLLDCSF